MKCGYCNGTGEHINDANRMTTCEFCGGKGIVEPMTNEEWFCSLPTKEKAKTIICLAVNSMHKWKKGLIDSDVGEIVRWLKAEHDSEEK